LLPEAPRGRCFLLHFFCTQQCGRVAPVAILGEPLHPELAACFGLSEPILCSSGARLATLSEAVAFMEERLLAAEPDLVVVLGSDRAALAAALGAAELGLPVAAADAGLRSGRPRNRRR